MAALLHQYAAKPGTTGDTTLRSRRNNQDCCRNGPDGVVLLLKTGASPFYSYEYNISAYSYEYE